MSDATITPISDAILNEDGSVMTPTQQLEGVNRALMTQLGEMGAQIPDSLLLQVQVGTLVDLLLPEGHGFREVYDHALEMTMNRILHSAIEQVGVAKEEAEAEARRNALTEGIKFAPPKDIV